jgi:hypothetical protein
LLSSSDVAGCCLSANGFAFAIVRRAGARWGGAAIESAMDTFLLIIGLALIIQGVLNIFFREQARRAKNRMRTWQDIAYRAEHYATEWQEIALQEIAVREAQEKKQEQINEVPAQVSRDILPLVWDGLGRKPVLSDYSCGDARPKSVSPKGVNQKQKIQRPTRAQGQSRKGLTGGQPRADKKRPAA